MKNSIFFISILLLSISGYSQNIITFSSGTNSSKQNGTIRQLFNDTIDNVLYAAGDFETAGGKLCYGIAKWNGTQWDSLSTGIKENAFSDIQYVSDVVRYKNEIYICGTFAKCGGKNIRGIARWNGTEWFDVGGSLIQSNPNDYPSVFRMEVYNNELFVIGIFSSIGNVPSKGIAKWDGQNWLDLSQNFNLDCNLDGLFSLIHYKGDLYVSGNLNCPNGDERLSKKVGNQWVTIGSTFDGDATINRLRIFQNRLYVGGYFFTQFGNVDNSMVSSDGISYFATNGGVLPSNLWDMFEYKGELYVCGQMNVAGGMPVNRIAKWTGTQWLNTGLSIENFYIQSNRGTLLTFAEYNGKLVMAGGFTSINGVAANNIASVDFGGVGVKGLNQNSPFKLYPNPTNSTFSIELSDFSTPKSISVYNAVGQLMLQQKTTEKTFDVSSYAKGMYVVELQTDKGISRQKLLVE